MRSCRTVALTLFALTLTACGSSKSDVADAEWAQTGVSASAPRNLGVNAYLWQASRDTLGFMPLTSVDPFGGLIVSDWYTPPGTPDERLKVVIHVMDRALRADGLKAEVFRQVRNGGEWQYAVSNPNIARQLEDAILTRARELRLARRKAESQ